MPIIQGPHEFEMTHGVGANRFSPRGRLLEAVPDVYGREAVTVPRRVVSRKIGLVWPKKINWECLIKSLIYRRLPRVAWPLAIARNSRAISGRRRL